MGSKPSHALPSNRPESGGTDRNDIREKSGLQERDKERLAQSDAGVREPGNAEPLRDRAPGEESGENH